MPHDPERDTYRYIIRHDPCAYCGRFPADTVDHIWPVAGGGPDVWHNLTPACASCNVRKSKMSLLEFLWREHVGRMPHPNSRRTGGRVRPVIPNRPAVPPLTASIEAMIGAIKWE